MLIDAAKEGNVATVRALLAGGFKPDVRDEDVSKLELWSVADFTPLIWAATRGHAEVCRVLLAAGAAVDAQDRGGWRALDWCAWYGHEDALRVLLDAGAAANYRNVSSGETALHSAAINGSIGCARLLVERGANITEVSLLGMTPAVCAHRRGREDMLRALIELGAPPMSMGK